MYNMRFFLNKNNYFKPYVRILLTSYLFIHFHFHFYLTWKHKQIIIQSYILMHPTTKIGISYSRGNKNENKIFIHISHSCPPNTPFEVSDVN